MTAASIGTTRIVVADDHPVLREGLKQLLSEREGFEVVGEAGDGRELVRRATELRPDVVVIDLTMPGMNGIQAARKLRGVLPDAKLIVLTVREEEELVYEALRAGVNAYVLKGHGVDDLAGAIDAALRGERYLSPAIDRLVVDTEGKAGLKTVSQQLTNREREVCKLLALGHTVPEIAAMIGISRKTVDVHKTRLMKKLAVHNRAELVTYAMKNGLVEV
mgnify:CR=1 FL=1